MRKKYLFLVIAICLSSSMMFGCKKKTPEPTRTPAANVATASNTKIGENYISSQNPFTSTDIGNIGKIDLIDYNDVHVTLTNWYGDVSESDVDTYINNLLSDNLVDVDRASEKGDTVIVDYTGTIDGKEFEGNTETDYSIELGSGQMLSDFENSLYGVKAGEVITATVNFPDDYNAEEVAGKTAIFQVTIKNVQTEPELNEDFISKFTKVGATTIDEFRKEIRDVIQVYYQKQNELMGIEVAIDQIADESELEPSDAFLQYLHDYYYDSMEKYLSDSGMTMDEYKEYTKMSDADIDEQIENMVTANAKPIMVLRKIAQEQHFDTAEQQRAALISYLKHYYSNDIKDEDLDDIYGNELDIMGLQAAVYNYMSEHVSIEYKKEAAVATQSETAAAETTEDESESGEN